MVAPRPYLSKSRLISAWQCPKKLHLEKHHPELGEVSAQTESLFATGNQVGDIAQQLYGTDESVEIAFNFKTMVAETKRLFEGGAAFPIFEATFRHENVLVRADVMIPDGDGWHVIEVKASTSVKDYHVLDCAIQDWVLRHSGINVLSISVAHVNNQFVYAGDGTSEGLLLENDLTEEVRSMEYTVLELVAKAREAVSGPMPIINVGAQCTKPYDCQFQSHCWPMDSEYPTSSIGGNREKIFEWVNRGIEDVRDIPASEITATRQQMIHRVATSGEAEITPGAYDEIKAQGFPCYHLDFETAMPAIPLWKGSRPYQTHAVQWSIHVDDGKGDSSLESIQHFEFLDLSGNAPMRPLAEKLIEVLGDSGPVMMFSSYEKTTINGLIKLFPDMEPQLQAIIDRLFDLQKVVRAHYYHPNMLGYYSIKDVAPTMNPDMDYATLEGIKEGGAAASGYVEAIHPDTTPERKAELEEQLLRYCKFDTEAMVEIVKYFKGLAE